jgi:hypothetical protein
MKNIELLIIVCVLFFVSESLIFGRDKGTDIADDVWNKIKAIEPLKEPAAEFLFCESNYSIIQEIYIDGLMSEYWFHLAKNCQDIFCRGLAEAAKHNQIESFAKAYVAKFGSDDTMSDMRWAISCPVLAALSDLIFDDTIKKTLSEEFKIFTTYYNKAIIEHSLASDVFYKRIVWFTLWAGNKPFREKNKTRFAINLFETFEDYCTNIEKRKWTENDYEYWMAIRYFLIIIYLCDWEETLKLYKMSSNNFNKENVTKIRKHFIRQNTFLLVPQPVFDREKIKYETDLSNLTYRLPPIELPTNPLPEYKYKWETMKSKKIKDLPRVSKMYFNDYLGLTYEFLYKVSSKNMKDIKIKN